MRLSGTQCRSGCCWVGTHVCRCRYSNTRPSNPVAGGYTDWSILVSSRLSIDLWKFLSNVSLNSSLDTLISHVLVNLLVVSRVGAKVRRQGLALWIGPNRVGSTWRRRQNPVSETFCVLNKKGTMDNVQKQNKCINLQTLTSRRMSSSGMWRCVYLALTDVSEECIASILTSSSTWHLHTFLDGLHIRCADLCWREGNMVQQCLHCR
jgi:hypothetical protein